MVLEHNDVGLMPGDVFAGHRIEREVGRGGMGVVYLAEHLRLERKVAIKILNPEFARDEAFLRRFIRESRLAAGLYHENIVQVFDAGEVDGVAYISMRFVDGTDLAALLRSVGTLTPGETVDIAGQVASALDFAHERGLVHRDVKPANILLEAARADGKRKAFLGDFGVTKLVSGEVTTESGQFVGTLDYTAPEQIRGTQVDGRADQYSLACVLFQCLAGGIPFPRDADVPKMFAHIQDPPPSLAGRGLAAGPAVDEVIRRAMAKRPADRFEMCVEFVVAAADALDVPRTPRASMTHVEARPPITAPIPAPPAGDGGRPRRSRRVRRTAVALLSTLVLLAGAAGAFILTRGDGGTRPPATPTVTGSSRTSPSPLPFPVSIAWVRVPNRGGIFGGAADQGINRVIAGPNGVVAVGVDANTGEDDAAVWISPDGWRGWHRAVIGVGAGPGTQGMSSVEWFDGQYVAVGGARDPDGGVDAAVWTSENGNTWNADPETAPVSEPGDQLIRRVIHAEPGLVGVGLNSHAGTSDAAVWEFDGSNWSRLIYSGFVRPGSQEMWGVTAFGNDLIAVGSDDASGALDAALWRFHAGDWKRVPVDSFGGPSDQAATAIAATGPGLVVVGSDSSSGQEAAVAWTSVDGVSWTEQTLEGPGQTEEPQEATNVIPFRGGAIAVGAIGQGPTRDAAVWTSPDGISWTRSTEEALGGPLAQHIKGLVVAGDRLVAVGRESEHDEGDAAVWVGTPSD